MISNHSNSLRTLDTVNANIIYVVNGFLKLCNGISGIAASGWAQLVFAPVDASLSDELPLLPLGFRIITINNYKVILFSSL